MKKSTLFFAWAGLYLACALLSLISAPSGGLKVILVLLSLLFFVPPLLLRLQNDPKTNRLLFYISLCSLVLTFLALLVSILSALGSTEVLGLIMHYVLLVVGVPGKALGSIAASLFIWACLLFSCLKGRK
jgi:hypothetical protein